MELQPREGLNKFSKAALYFLLIRVIGVICGGKGKKVEIEKMRIECCIFIIHPRFDHQVETVQILPFRGYRLVARSQATKERHPGLGNNDGSPSAQKY